MRAMLLVMMLAIAVVLVVSASTTIYTSTSLDILSRHVNTHTHTHTIFNNNQMHQSLWQIRGGGSDEHMMGTDHLLDSIFDTHNNMHQHVDTTSAATPSSTSTPSASTSSQQLHNNQQQQQHIQQHKQFISNLAISLQDTHISALQSLIKGDAAYIPPSLFGQTIQQEKSACAEQFYNDIEAEESKRKENVRSQLLEQLQLKGYNNNNNRLGKKEQYRSSTQNDGDEVTDDNEFTDIEPTFHHIEDKQLLSYWGLTPSAKLYGGAQYHRSIRYYHHLFLTSPIPPITQNEIALLTNGMNEVHDASDLLRAVVLLVQQKLQITMEDILLDMTRRLVYIMNRQWKLVEYTMSIHRPYGKKMGISDATLSSSSEVSSLYNKFGNEYTTAERNFKELMEVAYHKFVKFKAADAYTKSLEDIQSLLRYVTWDMGRPRKRGRDRYNKDRKNGSIIQEDDFDSHVEIVAVDSTITKQQQQSQDKNTKSILQQKKRQKRKDKTNDTTPQVSRGRQSNRFVARGGATIGTGPLGRKRSKLRDNNNNNMISNRNSSSSRGGEQSNNRRDKASSSSRNSYATDEGDLVGGVLNRGDLDDDDDENDASSYTTSLVVPLKSSPIFSEDDEVSIMYMLLC